MAKVSKDQSRLSPLNKTILIVVCSVIGIYLVYALPVASTVDFTVIRDKLAALGTEDPTEKGDEPKEFTADQLQERVDYSDASRATIYVETATNDYHKGSYKDALRRLDRAKIYDPANFSVFKLSGQIFFEKNKLRKAFNNWERATQLPHDDRNISRDLDVLRRLIRYSRNEIDNLRRTVHRNPGDRISRARLRELEAQMLE